MKKFLLVGADINNATDGVIVTGILQLLEHIYGKFEYKYGFIRDNKIQSYKDFYPEEKFDALFVSGTPWIWDQMQHTPKYKNLMMIRELHSKCKHVFMGIGTSVPLGIENTEIMRRAEDIKALQDMTKNSTVIVRDDLAYEYLNNAGVTAHLLPCPSFYCYGMEPIKQTIKEFNTMVYYEPKIGIAASTLSEKQLKHIYKEFKEFNKKYSPLVYVASESEIIYARKQGYEDVRLLKEWGDTLRVMYHSKNVLSGRVHCSVPAFMAGCNVKLLAVDSRARVLENMREKDIFSYLTKYRELVGNL